MTLKVGDKVRVRSTGRFGTVVADRDYGFYDVRDPGRTGPSSVTPGALVYRAENLEKIEDEKPRPLGLRPGDKVVNLKTGREGLVLKGPISGELKVYDQKPPIKTAVPAQALEEYEFHYPGTYDVWRRVTENKKAQPW